MNHLRKFNEANGASFVDMFHSVRRKSTEYIKDMAPIGETIMLATNEVIEDQGEEFYELPYAFTVDKYGSHNEYAIGSITNTDGGLEFNGFGRGENGGDTYTFTEGELETLSLCEIADFFKEF